MYKIIKLKKLSTGNTPEKGGCRVTVLQFPACIMKKFIPIVNY